MTLSLPCKDRDRIKWRCPIKASKKLESLKCDFIAECSPSEYGRVVYTHPADNPRLYPNIPRNSQKWQHHYDKRTSVERVFKREKNDFSLTSFKSRFRERINRILSERNRLDEVTNQLWYEFNRHFYFLQEEGYVDKEGHLSADGMWASQLRLDQPLLVAECIRSDVFPHDDPAMLAGLIAPFVTDRDNPREPLERLNLLHPKLGQSFAKMTSALHPFRRRLRQGGFLVNPLSFWPAASAYSWITGSTWEELVEKSGFREQYNPYNGKPYGAKGFGWSTLIVDLIK